MNTVEDCGSVLISFSQYCEANQSHSLAHKVSYILHFYRYGKGTTVHSLICIFYLNFSIRYLCHLNDQLAIYINQWKHFRLLFDGWYQQHEPCDNLNS